MANSQNKATKVAISLKGVLVDLAKLQDKKLAAGIGAAAAVVLANSLGVTSLSGEEVAGILSAIGIAAATAEKL